MTGTVEIPLWALLLMLAFAAIAALDKILAPSVRWFFRRRMERAVARLNKRLARPIEPFKLARRHDMIQRLIYDPKVAEAISETAREEGIPESVVFERARAYAREIVPRFSATAYFGFATRAASWLSRQLYRVRLGHFDREALEAIDPEATVIFVINHRSNMDYVLVTFLAADRTALSYAVGEWARVWPLKPLIHAMGAYFIRRRSRNPLYRRVLARYVQMATAGGATQAIFPEGGLSLDGGLRSPRLGLLNYVVTGFDPAGGRDVVFVPVALNYDRVLEDRVLLAARREEKPRFRVSKRRMAGFVAHQLWLKMTGRFRRYGYAAVSFAAPVSLREFMRAHGRENLTEALAGELMARIGAVVPVVPVPLVATVLLRAEGPLEKQEIKARAARLAIALEDCGAHVHVPRDSLEYAAEKGFGLLVSRHIAVEREGRYQPDPRPGQREALAYYANSIAHLVAKCGACDISGGHKITK